MYEEDIRAAIYSAVATHEDHHHRNTPAGTFMAVRPFRAYVDPDEDEDELATVVGVAQHEVRRDSETDEPVLQFIVITTSEGGVLKPRFSPWVYGEQPYKGTTTSSPAAPPKTTS